MLSDQLHEALTESAGMTSTQFAQTIERGAPKGKTIRVDPFNKFSKSYDTVHITFINLAPGDGGQGGGAKAMNNRILIQVKGFRSDKDEPATKVKAELSVRSNFDKMRAKSGAPDKVAKYILAYLAKQAEKEPA